ncbi:C2H2-type zinc finger protein KNAG_0H01070 [Huiozyma naganishii CBS 8797]|uniref:C2H2-type domain-containing protein n=1 Tax=Huiozyma naganishii (strain ATCC MYA-139 / BCRC 22969 / CBS 8797 / KCTC 17520 / NBRC 10181 / NCYC 3082 / Yp74L-3) TaxID=1071383 RepID=J7R9J0_HUIN7|nr:hypothetical protein KNAG_0H01070 [Kazachstania naganishii CBS 8797]CCK71520.1 hypothetical protein KNAG_0H01070 [Kazachstania naganishii CBS 8797]
MTSQTNFFGPETTEFQIPYFQNEFLQQLNLHHDFQEDGPVLNDFEPVSFEDFTTLTSQPFDSSEHFLTCDDQNSSNYELQPATTDYFSQLFLELNHPHAGEQNFEQEMQVDEYPVLPSSKKFNAVLSKDMNNLRSTQPYDLLKNKCDKSIQRMRPSKRLLHNINIEWANSPVPKLFQDNGLANTTDTDSNQSQCSTPMTPMSSDSSYVTEMTFKTSKQVSQAPTNVIIYQHSKKNRYGCSICGKRFARPSSLNTHLNTHTGDKPYTCPHGSCSKVFNARSNMTRHYKTHFKLSSGVYVLPNGEVTKRKPTIKQLGIPSSKII